MTHLVKPCGLFVYLFLSLLPTLILKGSEGGTTGLRPYPPRCGLQDNNKEQNIDWIHMYTHEDFSPTANYRSVTPVLL